MESDYGTVIDFLFSIHDTHSEVTIQYNAIRIHIAISEDNLKNSDITRDQYLRFLEAANGDESNGLTVDDFYDWILAGCGPMFSQLTRQPSLPSNPTLEHYIHAKTYRFILVASEESQLTLLPATDSPAKRFFSGIHYLDEICVLWPSFELSQLSICAESPQQALSKPPKKVLTKDGEAYFFKKHDAADSDLIRRELRKFAEIRRARLMNVRIPELHGLVRGHSGQITGLLLTYIESTSTLACAIGPETPICLRDQWARQITETLYCLHDAGIVWGDAKPDNILVDTQRNVWVIDFGGGYTEGWVDKGLAETILGDQQGLSRIIDYINSC